MSGNGWLRCSIIIIMLLYYSQLSSVTINIVLTDTSGKPIDALVSEKEIEESGGRERLEQVTGLSVASVGALDSSERGDENSGKTQHVYDCVHVDLANCSSDVHMHSACMHV